MARDDDRIVGQRHQLFMDRAKNLPAISSWQVGASDAVAKQRVTGEQCVFDWYPQADTALRVTGRVQCLQFRRAEVQRIAVAERAIDLRTFRGRDAQPAGLC